MANTHIAVFSKQEVAVISISVAHSPGDCIFECVIYDCIDMFGGRRIDACHLMNCEPCMLLVVSILHGSLVIQ